MLPRNHPVQIILFSATFPDQVRSFASKFAPNANKIELQKEELSVEGIRQFYMDCKNEEHKYDILVSLYSLLTIGQSIIFCQVSPNSSNKSRRRGSNIIVVAPAYGGQNFGADDYRRA